MKYLTTLGAGSLGQLQSRKRASFVFYLGAISLAIEDVIRQKILPEEHTLDMVVAETFGEEEESILQTAKLWTLNVSAYVGPQESCVHEARMAASFRLPMISYVSSLSCRL